MRTSGPARSGAGWAVRSSFICAAGTWAAADWAIRFYLRNGFELVTPDRKTALLKTYWTIPDRQVETSVVLANPGFDED